MKPIPRDWLVGARDINTFDQWIRASHQAATDTAAYQQWHYAVDDALLALVDHWHETRQCQHVEYFDLYHDTRDRVLEQKGGRLRTRQCWGHSERKVRHDEARGEDTVRWPKPHEDPRVVLWGVAYGRAVTNALQSEFKLKPVRESSYEYPGLYCPDGVAGRMFHRYAPKHESNPRWWIEDGRVLVVEMDPVARGWDSDDDEVLEHDKPVEPLPHDNEHVETRVAKVSSCKACVHKRAAYRKVGLGQFVPVKEDDDD